MTNQEKNTLYSVLLRLIDDDNELTPLERRDLMNTITHACCGMTADDILTQTGNNRKLLIKRGTTAQNDEYTGLAGEITMDTDTNTLRIHDGQTQGGHAVTGGNASNTQLPENIDYVVEWQNPTAENDYTWYRKYASGWVEMGGEIIAGTGTVTLPMQMANDHYTLIRTQVGATNQSYYPGWVAGYDTKTTTDFTFAKVANVNIWYVCGQCANV
ncbi:MAG: hypothetical protein K2M34_01040 [Alphaproteobacteria bacterium]|nr:hypothetical protein [Alphaproteobacteria bacterium]